MELFVSEMNYLIDGNGFISYVLFLCQDNCQTKTTRLLVLHLMNNFK